MSSTLINDLVNQFDPKSQTDRTAASSLWEVKPDEQSYARLNDVPHQPENIYGHKIDLLDLTQNALPAGRSLYINDNPEVGCNPNRNKQHGFYFNADNCIGCHACEAACAEKNETPSHIAFRSVGYVEGGSYPDYQRLNISMACNHCDDPVCLKGCPTAAYTKHVEYGAVLQDPDTCFGCGYCTWVCPYNAPQLDPVEGHVSKCNMCVDRLEVGLKPACVSACVGNALDFGIIENIPDKREQAKAQIPGFPDPNITHPNIRFQQTRSLPEEMSRTDSNPVKYHRQSDDEYLPVVDKKHGTESSWNIKSLSSRENVLVAFTLASQTAIGLFSLVCSGLWLNIDVFVQFRESAGYLPFALTSFALISVALFMSTVHLGKPLRFYRGFNNLKYSPVSREGLGIALFMLFLGVHIVCSLASIGWVQDLGATWFGSSMPTLIQATTSLVANISSGLAVIAGMLGLYYMVQCYRIPARPFWNHWQVATSFIGNALALGGLIAAAFVGTTLALTGNSISGTMHFLGSTMFIGLLMEAVGLYFHAKAMHIRGNEGAAAHFVQTTRFGKTYRLRNVLLLTNLLLIAVLVSWNPSGFEALCGWSIVATSLLITSIIGRALFYVLVIPTTMPGAFFWKNPAFEDHARKVGLANLPQTGVAPLAH